MSYLHLLRTALLLFVCLHFVACSTESGDVQFQNTTVSVALTSTTTNYDAVSLEITDVLLKTIDDDSIDNCWLSLNFNSEGVYNFSDLSSSSSLSLINNQKIPAGEVYEVWLVLGDNNTMVKDGVEYALSMPSIHQSGLRVRAENFLSVDESYLYELKIHLSESIVATNLDNHYVLRPLVTLQLRQQ